MAKVGYILHRRRHRVDSVCAYWARRRVAYRVFVTATWLDGCARVLTNCLLLLMLTIFLILTTINSIL